MELDLPGGLNLSRDYFQRVIINGRPPKKILTNGIFTAHYTASVLVATRPSPVLVDIYASPHVDGFSWPAPIGTRGTTSQAITINSHFHTFLDSSKSTTRGACLNYILALIWNI
jgi:hypothetical protein